MLRLRIFGVLLALGCGDDDAGGGAAAPDAGPCACASDGDCAPEEECVACVCVRRPGAALGDGCACDDDCATLLCFERACSLDCAREADCPVDFACAARARDDDGDDVPDAVATACLRESAGGAALGAACASGDDCRTGLCHLGVCAEVCDADDACGEGFVCEDAAAYEGGARWFRDGCPLRFDEAARLGLCLPARGLLTLRPGAGADGESFAIDIPPRAASLTLIAEGAPDVEVGFRALAGPGWQDLYVLPSTQEQLLAQPVRYLPARGASTLLVPNTPDLAWARGTHCAFVLANGEPAPEVTALVKMGAEGDVAGGTLDLDFYLLDLQGAGCGLDDLDAASAPAHDAAAELRDGLAATFAAAGVDLGDVAYHDRRGRPDLDEVDSRDPDELDALFALGTDSRGRAVDVFLVRAIVDAVGVTGTIPGPPGLHGVSHAGVAASATAACDGRLARVVAHEIGHFLGLFHTEEADGTFDPIADTGDAAEEPDNLMVRGGEGTALTPGQGFVLRRHPSVR